MPFAELHPVALVCTALLGLLLFGLGLAVSGARGRSRRLIGVDDDPDSLLNRLVRAHGNTAEYAPFLGLLFLLLGSRSPSGLVLGLIVAATAARLLLALGLLTARTLSRPSALRFVGAAGTYVTGAWLSLLLLTGA
ncbi:MAPEG family protein [Rubrivivax gelatinosus]|uniref:MAPEG superfamily protein n=2 Tax=Rubrivivax gelatinosus TaxID=28068 RepID=I0HTS8_RUBGI|nr:MAPEG family protein [Rubrivivax gelatinosus]MBG6078315.1 putative membrane protein YecN with MAPEG domain [Rubrivivax gelatinosus]MBK1687606.1 hypothetical protein [Rubrivivax gelatinosus]TCP02979.1 hypothetical protein EV684_105145 [Rubrivivax gelatinosus]BAL96415.1 hypothetical protein RGE_30760 [Rubrivivax gelatinosus IL144]